MPLLVLQVIVDFKLLLILFAESDSVWQNKSWFFVVSNEVQSHSNVGRLSDRGQRHTATYSQHNKTTGLPERFFVSSNETGFLLWIVVDNFEIHVRTKSVGSTLDVYSLQSNH